MSVSQSDAAVVSPTAPSLQIHNDAKQNNRDSANKREVLHEADFLSGAGVQRGRFEVVQRDGAGRGPAAPQVELHRRAQPPGQAVTDLRVSNRGARRSYCLTSFCKMSCDF